MAQFFYYGEHDLFALSYNNWKAHNSTKRARTTNINTATSITAWRSIDASGCAHALRRYWEEELLKPERSRDMPLGVAVSGLESDGGNHLCGKPERQGNGGRAARRRSVGERGRRGIR